MALTTRTVTGTYQRLDGSPASGGVTFEPNAALSAGSSDVMVPATPVTATLVNGAFTVTLVCTDNAGVSPTGWAYTVVERITGADRRTYTISVPAGGSALDLADVTPLVTVPTLVTYVLASTVGQVGGPAGPLDASTTVPDAQVAPPARRPSDHGVAGWTFPSWAIQSGGNANYAVVGQLYVGRLKVARATTLTKGWLYIATIPSGTPSNAYLGLYDSTGTLRASTTDQGAAWATTGLKSPSFAAGYVAAAGEYYIGVLIGGLSAGSTMPALAQATIGGALTGLTNFNLTAGAGAGLLYGTTGSGLSALPASITPASLTASERAVFFATV